MIIALMQNELFELHFLPGAAVGRGCAWWRQRPISGRYWRPIPPGVDWLVVNDECRDRGLLHGGRRARCAGVAALSRASVFLLTPVRRIRQLEGRREIRQCVSGPGGRHDRRGRYVHGYFVGCSAQGMERKDAMQYAAMAASIAVTRPGAAPHPHDGRSPRAQWRPL